MTPYCWDVVLSGWMIVWLGIRIGSNGWSPLKWLGSTWKQRLTKVLSWPSTPQPVFIKISLRVYQRITQTGWSFFFFHILFIFPSLRPFFFFQSSEMLCFLELQMCFLLTWRYLWASHTVRAKLNNHEQVLTSFVVCHEGNSSGPGLDVELWVSVKLKTCQHQLTIYGQDRKSVIFFTWFIFGLLI